MKVLDFIKKKKDETASTGAIKTENSMAVIANLFIQSKKYSLLSDKYNGNVIYFVLGNDTLLYVFILRSMDDYQSKYVLKDNFGKNISIQILFNIDVNEMTEGTPFPTIENWSSIKDFLNTNKIFKTIESSSLARLAFVSMIEGLTFLSQISFSNYKIPITNSQVKQEDEEPEKQVFSETKATTIKKAIASVEEAQNDVDDNIEKKDEVVEDAVVSNESNTDKDESIIKATSEDISRHTFEEISKKVEDMTPKTKTNVSTKYFIGYKIVNSLDSTGKEAWTYELNKDKKPVKLFFAPNNIGKIIASHMFINGKTGSGKTSFNNSLIHTLLYHGVNVFAFDIKTGSLDYSATIIKKPESKEDVLKMINDQKYKGLLPEDKNIEFTPDDIPDDALEVINPNIGTFTNRFGKKVIPLVIYNNPDESTNIKFFTSINILNNELRNQLIDFASKGDNYVAEYNAIKQEYKEGLNQMLIAYLNTLTQGKYPKKFVETMADFVTSKVINYMEKTEFRIMPTNSDFAELLHDYSMFGKDLKPDSEEIRFMEYIYDNNISKRIIDFENGTDLHSILKAITQSGSNFYLTIRCNTSLLSFYVIYLYYLLSKSEKLKIDGMKEGEAYTAMFIDEAHYLDKNQLLDRVLKDAQRTDRLRNRGWIFSAQRVFMSSFGKQESLGTYVFFAGQSGDIASQKTKFSKILSKEAIEYVNSNILSFTTDNNDLIIDENGSPLDRISAVVKSFPNRAYSKDIMEFGIAKYAEEINPYLIQNQILENKIYIKRQKLDISLRTVGDDGKLTISSLNEGDRFKLSKLVSDLSLQLSSLLSASDLNEKEITEDSLQYIQKILLLVEISREVAPKVEEILNKYIYVYNSENNLQFIMELNDLLNEERRILSS
jgi:hypothetical protein